MEDLIGRINRHELTVPKLKEELKSRGLKVTGNKSELEDRLRFNLTTGGHVVPGQKGRPRKKVEVKGNIPIGGKGLKFPTVPKGVPKTIPKTTQPSVPLEKDTFGPSTQPRLKTTLKVSDHLYKISELKTLTISGRLTVDQLKRELTAIGNPTTGNKKELSDRLYDYLNLISVTDQTNWVDVTVDQKTGDIGPVFDHFWKLTTEPMLQTANPGYYISFFDNNRKSYHTFQISTVKRSPFNLVEQIVLDPVGYSLIRIKNNWRLVYQPQAGNLGSANQFSVSIAATLRII